MERASKKQINEWNKLSLFLFSCGIVELCSKLMLEMEQNAQEVNLIYLILFAIVALFLFLGASSLIDIYLKYEYCDTKNK